MSFPICKEASPPWLLMKNTYWRDLLHPPPPTFAPNRFYHQVIWILSALLFKLIIVSNVSTMRTGMVFICFLFVSLVLSLSRIPKKYLLNEYLLNKYLWSRWPVSEERKVLELISVTRYIFLNKQSKGC